MALEHLQSVVGGVRLGMQVPEEVAGEDREVGESLAQGWDFYGEDREAKVEVGAEVAVAGLSREVTVGGSHDSNVGKVDLAAANAANLTRFKGSKQGGLATRR